MRKNEEWFSILQGDKDFKRDEFLNTYMACDCAQGRTLNTYRKVLLNRRDKQKLNCSKGVENLRGLFLEPLEDSDVSQMMKNNWTVEQVYAEVINTGCRFCSVAMMKKA